MERIFEMKPIKRYFNMVEVALAMAVVGLGIAGIMSLFPVGLNASRDAIGDNYSADATNDFIQYIIQFARVSDTNWDVLKGLPTSNPGEAGEGASADLTGWTNPIPQYPQVYMKNGVSYLFRIYQGKDIPTNTDFRGAIRLWISPVTVNYFSGSWQVGNISSDDAIGLNIEISWPVERPYDQRSKRFIYTEVFKNM
jgi:hypothetical protein